jgi:hypothetical protein
MILISHRGNLTGPNPDVENSPDQIQLCIANGFEVEVDVWYVDNEWFLGHDKPRYKITIEFFLMYQDKLWIHCKNYKALEKLRGYYLNYFWHETDACVLTSKKDLWALPRKDNGPHDIIVMPEKFYSIEEIKKIKCWGICSDYVEYLL